jgi:predicted  nucleic acid-binding Zn-ribbon protein
MKDVLVLMFLLLCAVQIQSHSIITDDSGPNVTQLTTNNLDLKQVNLLRQLLNQETIIRMGLEKNLQDLKKDVITMKTANQKTNSDVQQEVEKLKQENQKLQLENVTMKQSIETLKAESQKSNSEMADLQREVQKLKQENQRLQLQNSKYEETLCIYHDKLYNNLV